MLSLRWHLGQRIGRWWQMWYSSCQLSLSSWLAADDENAMHALAGADVRQGIPCHHVCDDAMASIQLEIPGLEGFGESGSPAGGTAVDVGARRQELLDLLFHAAGRAEPEHPQVSTYTGLAMDFHRRVGQTIVEKLLETPGFEVSWLLGSADA